MAINFQPLPVSEFPENLRPRIKHLNVVLRELCALEGTIRQPRNTRRSDATVARRDEVQVDVSRITPSITQVVSGQSTVVGVPALTLSTSNAVGSTTTAVSINSTVAIFGTQAPAGLSNTAAVGSSAYAARADHVHEHPPALQSEANNATLRLTDDGTDSALTGNLGALNIFPGSGGHVFISPQVASNASRMLQVSPAPTSSVDAIQVTISSPTGSSGMESKTFRGLNFFAALTGSSFNTCTISGQDLQANITPAAGSSGANNLYQQRLTGGLINNSNASFTDVVQLDINGPRRLVANPTIGNSTASIRVECPTIGVTQIGLLIRQRTAQQTATVRAGIYIDPQNSGTNRYCIYGVSDRAQFTGPLTVDGAFGLTGAATLGSTTSVGGYLTHTGPKLGVLGATPTAQYGTTGTVNGFAAGTSTAVTVDSTFTGDTGTRAYTFADIVRSLKLCGIISY